MNGLMDWLRSQLAQFLPLLVLLLVVVSAVAVVAMKQHARSLQMRSQELVAERERMEVEYNQLRLERGTIGAHARVEELATSRLKMKSPDEYAIVQVPRAD